jgi:ribokinase
LANRGRGQTPPAIVIVGSINADLIAYADEDKRIGNYVFGDSFRFNLGGKGLNQAMNAAATGANVVLIGRMGDDIFGQKISSDLIREGVDTKYLAVDQRAHTGIGHIRVNDAGEYDTVVVNGANGHLSFAEVDAAVSDIGEVSFGLMNYEIASEVISSSAAKLRERGASTIINYSPVVPGVNYVITDSDYLVANADEVRAILETEESNVETLAKKLQDRGAKHVIVTLGEDGVFGLTESGQVLQVAANEVTVVNTIGAGDTFLASFAVGLQSGASFEDSMAFANYAAALVCTKQVSFLAKADLQVAAQKFAINIPSN